MSGGSNGGSKLTETLAKAPDPANISHGGGGLDPANFFGPKPYVEGGGPSVLPLVNNAPGINHPHFYSPNSFGPRQAQPGTFNAMAAQLAGPQYNPTPMAKKGTGTQGPVRGVFGGNEGNTHGYSGNQSYGGFPQHDMNSIIQAWQDKYGV